MHAALAPIAPDPDPARRRGPGSAPAPAPRLAPTASRGRGRDRSASWRAAARLLIAGTSIGIALLWLLGGGPRDLLGTSGEAVSSVGRLTGLVSANLLLHQVLLMARVPVLERGLGRDAIARLHRTAGFWSFWLMLAHIALITLGYAQTASVDVLAQFWDLVWDYPGMLLATGGALLLVLVVVTSIRRARRRLRYESWHLLHLYAYLGAGLAVPHMLWTGTDLGGALPSLYWWTLWAAAALAVVVWRVAVPLTRSARSRLRVDRVELEGDHGVTVRMRGRRLDRLGARAGQFFVWRFLDGPGWTRGHPFSLAAAPTDDELVITVRRVGDGTDRLARLRPGTRVLVEGPYGEMTGDRRRGAKLLLLAAGAGVAPLLGILESERYAPGDALLVTREHGAGRVLGADRIARLVHERGLVHATLDGPRARRRSSWLPASHIAWRGPELIRFLAPDVEDCDVYVCGPAPWTASLRRDLLEAGAAADRIHSEAFSL